MQSQPVGHYAALFLTSSCFYPGHYVVHLLFLWSLSTLVYLPCRLLGWITGYHMPVYVHLLCPFLHKLVPFSSLSTVPYSEP